MEYALEIVAALACFGLMATVCYTERRHSYSRDALLLGLLLFGVESLLCAVATRATQLPDILFWLRWRFLTMSLLPACWLLFSVTYARGNSIAYIRRAWAFLLAFAVVLPGLVLLSWQQLIQARASQGTPNLPWLALGQPCVVLHMLFILGCVLCLMNLERSLRTSIGTMRWRIKYMIIGLGMVLIVRCYSSSQSILYSVLDLSLASWNACALLPGCALMFLAVHRGSLHAVDLYPSHRILHGSLTLILAATYLLFVGGLAELAKNLGVATWFPLKAFALLLSLLGLAAIFLSDRLRHQLRQFVSRHFHREQYDYRHLWARFSEQTGTATEPPAFCRAVTRLIADTLETLSVTIWLVAEDGHRLTPGGSSALSEAEARQLISTDIYLSDETRRLLRTQTTPVPVRAVVGEPGEVVRQLAHNAFKNGGEYFCLALTTREELFGLLVLGDRVNGTPFTTEELELLKAIGCHLTAHLQRIRLSARLADAKKLEAFQTMSAFFVHDLKNTASTLSLMLQNLPRHFDDPAFRKDALQAIARSTDKLNHVITRLSYFRQPQEMHPLPTDLTALAGRSVATWRDTHPGPVTLALSPVPPVMADEEQLQNVIANLLTNAHEASPPDAPIHVHAGLRDGWVYLEVADQGCGMTNEFMAQSLFQPFQTTKPRGIGIGLIHCKTIVEAHGGRLQVKSRLAEGSRFCICLPPREEYA